MAALISSQTQAHTAEIRRLCADAVPSGMDVAPEMGAAVEQDFLMLRPHRTSHDALSAQVRRVDDHDLLVRFRNRDEQLVFEFWTNSFTRTVTPEDQSVDLLVRYCAEQFPGTLRRFRTRIRRPVRSPVPTSPLPCSRRTSRTVSAWQTSASPPRSTVKCSLEPGPRTHCPTELPVLPRIGRPTWSRPAELEPGGISARGKHRPLVVLVSQVLDEVSDRVDGLLDAEQHVRQHRLASRLRHDEQVHPGTPRPK